MEEETEEEKEEKRIRDCVLNKKQRNTRKHPAVIGRTAGIYDISSEIRGWCLIFANIKFEELETLLGYATDAEYFRELFVGLQFKTKVFLNTTTLAMSQILQYYANRSASNGQFPTNACAVVILTHGNENALFGVSHGKGNPDIITMTDIQDIFSNKNCEHLRQKPKLFFVQACRGANRDPGLTMQASYKDPYGHTGNSCTALANPYAVAGSTESKEQGKQTISLPSIAEDVMICYATTPGMVSYVLIGGSVFGVQCTYVFKRRAWVVDLQGLLNEVSLAVQNKEVTVSGGLKEKQTVQVVFNGWKKKLFFNPGYIRNKQVDARSRGIDNIISPPMISSLASDSQSSGDMNEETVATAETTLEGQIVSINHVVQNEVQHSKKNNKEESVDNNSLNPKDSASINNENVPMDTNKTHRKNPGRYNLRMKRLGKPLKGQKLIDGLPKWHLQKTLRNSQTRNNVSSVE